MTHARFRQRIEDLSGIVERAERAGRGDAAEALEARRARLGARWLCGELDRCRQEYALLMDLEARRRRRKGLEEPTPPLWDGSPRAGRGLLVRAAEAGYGDLFQYIRFVAGIDPAKGPVTVFTRPDLVRLFAASFDPRISWVAAEPSPPTAELAALWFELAVLVGWSADEISASVPYLRPPAEVALAWRARLADRPRPRVGLCWTNSLPGQCIDERHIDLARFAPLLARPATTFVSLQKGRRDEEIAAAGFGHQVLDFGDELVDFAQTAGLMSELDLVVSIDTAVCHLAGAIGLPVWLLLMHEHCDRWWLGPDPDRVPDYPTTRLFRQPRAEDWETVLGALGRRLAELPTPPATDAQVGSTAGTSRGQSRRR